MAEEEMVEEEQDTTEGYTTCRLAAMVERRGDAEEEIRLNDN
jgi:hypothetical protein